MAESGLRIERFIFNEFGENTYLLYAPKGEGIVIDLGCNSDEEWAQIAAFVEGAECKIKYLLNTHAHLDHLFGVPRGRTAWSAPFLLHQADLHPFRLQCGVWKWKQCARPKSS